MAIITAYGEISNLNDGAAGISVVHSNSNHTFPATAEVQVDSAALADFSDTIQVFVGTDQYTFVGGVNPTLSASQWSMEVTPPAPADLTPVIADDGTTATITLIDADTITTGFVDLNADDTSQVNSVIVNVAITLNIAGTDSTLNSVISLSKAIGGSAPLVTISSNTGTVRYNAAGDISRTTDVVMTGASLNISTGLFVWSYRIAAAGAFTDFTSGDIRVTGTNDNTLTLNPTQFTTLIGTNDNITFNVRRGDMAFDQASIARLQDATDGVNFAVQLAVLAGNPFFRNGTGSVTYRADVLRNAEVLSNSDHMGFTYAWALDGVPDATRTARTASFSFTDIDGDADMTKLVSLIVNTNP